MYPNDQQPQYSVDYLNQIAGPQPRSGGPKHLKALVIGGIILLLLSFIIIIFGILNSKEEPTPVDLAVRLKTLEMVARESQENLSSGDLRSINSNLTLALTNSSRDMNQFLGEAASKTIEKTAKESPEGAKLKKTLSDADLNAVMSRTYPREISYELDVTLLLLQTLHKETNNEQFKTYLSKTYDDLKPINDQLAAFNQD